MLRHLLNGHRAALWYVLLVVCLPIGTLVILGLIHLLQSEWLLGVSIAWLATTLTGFALYKFWPEKSKAHASTQPDLPSATGPDDDSVIASLPVQLEPRPDWTSLDRRVWIRTLSAVEQIVEASPEWQALPEHAVQLLSTISRHYDIESRDTDIETMRAPRPKDDAAYSFTLPEMLLVLSVTSIRYRQFLLSHVPFAERIKVSSLLSLYARQDQIIKGAGWLNTIRRTVRLANPLAAFTAELRDQFTQRIFTNLSEKVQNDLKRLLLQELSQVAMDLYSGRLKHSSGELSDYVSQSQVQDAQAHASQAEPLRVLLIGQVSSGKSSLINTLVKRLEAETGILPTTNQTTVHVLEWKDDLSSESEHHSIDPVHLIDTVGVTDSPESIETTLSLARQADLILWVARATQPARAPDSTLCKALIESLEAQPERLPPPIVLVVTHVDQLSPKAEWNPPYDLTDTHRKAQTISQAIESCKRQIGLPDATPVVPVCLAENRETYNIDVLAAQLIAQQADATQAQLNRRRTEKNSQSGTWHDRWEQASNLGTVTGKLLLRSIRF